MITFAPITGGGWAVLCDGEPIGWLAKLLRGNGWRAGLFGEPARGCFATRYEAGEHLVGRITASRSAA